MTRSLRRLAALLVAIAIAGTMLAATPQVAAEEYSDATLEAFVTASFETSRLIEAWRPHIEAESDEDARNALIQEAEADVARAIKRASGLSVDEYYAILGAALADETLRARIQRMVSARQNPSVPRAE